MPTLHRLGPWVAVVLAVGALVPAAALADGSSAGDQQYIDPLSGMHHKHHTTTTTTTTTTQPPPTTTPPVVTTPTTTTAASPPPATTARARHRHDPGSLPFTGYDALLGATLGGCLLASGVGLRRATRRGDAPPL